MRHFSGLLLTTVQFFTYEHYVHVLGAVFHCSFGSMPAFVIITSADLLSCGSKLATLCEIHREFVYHKPKIISWVRNSVGIVRETPRYVWMSEKCFAIIFLLS